MTHINPRTVFGDDDFTFFRLKLLEVVENLSRYRSDAKQREIELKKADQCLTYLMNYRPDQPEW
jgi:hypothetical protein